jgi:hypothetical protein
MEPADAQRGAGLVEGLSNPHGCNPDRTAGQVAPGSARRPRRVAALQESRARAARKIIHDYRHALEK